MNLKIKYMDALERADHCSEVIDRMYDDVGDNNYRNWRSFNE